jgi:peptidoglycan/LPS O-acetylase OafA/YrhL
MGSPHRPVSARLAFLDGLRGLAALHVVLFHCWHALFWDGPPPGRLYGLTFPLAGGRFAVTVFIVLSGFVLAWPLARDGSLRGGLRGFFLRRARRILPPYYAALALSLLAGALLPAAYLAPGSYLALASPCWGGGVLLSHLLLLHNLDGGWVWKVNIPFWSVATEWQIYFAFALVLVPLWRRWGPAAAAAVGWAGGLALAWLYPPLWTGAAWFLGCFALGLWAADTAARRPGWLRRGPWAAGALLGFGAFLGLLAWAVNARADFLRSEWRFNPALDALVGAATACLILWGCRGGWPGRVLASRPLVRLGGFSYSLYLVHWPVVAVLDAWGRLAGLGAWERAALLFGVTAPLSVGVAFLFYLVFERPFLRDARPAPAPADGVRKSGVLRRPLRPVLEKV